MATYQNISSYTVTGSSTSSFEFTSIPNTYTDLCLWVSARIDRAGQSRSGMRITFNNSTGDYDWQRFVAYDGNNQLGEAQNAQSFATFMDATASTTTNNVFASGLFYIAGYTPVKYKTFGSDVVIPNADVTTPFVMEWNGGRWQNDTAISSIQISGNGYNFLANTTAYLYGISNA
jgi:hypothetical protein